MNTYKEIVYMILDEIKAISDDSYFEEEHILFLMNIWRAKILSQRYGDIRRDVSIDNYQTICMKLEDTRTIYSSPCEQGYMRTTVKIPNIMKVGAPRVHSLDLFKGDISLVSFDRFRYVGHNKYLKNVIYATIGPDSYLYIRSLNPQHRYLEMIRLTGVFSNPSQAFELRCSRNQEGDECDMMNTTFPLENKLIPDLVQVVVKELLGASYRPQDEKNNSQDDLSQLSGFLRNITNRDFQRRMNGEEE